MKKAFTVIETLVSIAIIALLIAIIVPALNKAKQYKLDQDYINSPEYVPPRFDEKELEAIDIISDLTYIRDSRSGFVYALRYSNSYQDSGYSGYGWGYGYLTIIPEDMVHSIEHLIINSGMDD